MTTSAVRAPGILALCFLLGLATGCSGNRYASTLLGHVRQPSTPTPVPQRSPSGAPADCGILASGSSLAAATKIASCDGKSYLALQSDGNLVLYTPVGPVWATMSSKGNSARMQGDGNFVLSDANGITLWSTGTAGKTGAVLKVQDGGNLALVLGSDTLWQSDTLGASQPCTGLVAGASLTEGQFLQACTGKYRLSVLRGDVVESGPGGQSAYLTTSASVARLVMQSDGNLVASTSANAMVFNTGTFAHPGAKLAIDGSGKLTVGTETQLLWEFAALTPVECGRMLPGKSLQRGQTLASCNNLYKLSMQNDGNLILWGPVGGIWGVPVGGIYTAVLQSGGLLMARDASNGKLWSAGGGGSPDAQLNLTADGDIVIADANKVIWRSGTAGMTFPCGMMPGGKTLPPGNRLQSCDASYRLEVSGGNIVRTGPNRQDTPFGYFGTLGSLILKADGTLVASIANVPNGEIGLSAVGTPGSNLFLGNDGSLVLRAPDGREEQRWNPPAP